MQFGFHHHHQRTQHTGSSNAHNERITKIMDDLLYVIGTFGVLIYLPQLIQVWTANDISGVSIISWGGMFIASFFWTFYGIVHKARPIIFINILATIIQLSVVIGLVLRK